jgi:hypothetical protein
MEPFDDRPCPPPGQIRRDGDPHRGPLLLRLACVSIGCVPVSLLLLVLGGLIRTFEPLACLIVLLPGLEGLILAVAAEKFASRDLSRIAIGEVDPRGNADTTRAVSLARHGIVFNACGLLFSMTICLAMLNA